MSKLETYLRELVLCPSVTPSDHGCQAFMISCLKELGFTIHQFNKNSVSNFYARFGHQGPHLMFAGHTDVVSPGDLSAWKTPPFSLVSDQGMLFGRGVADMKGSLAAMLVMAEQFVQENPEPNGSLSFLITSGEEGYDYLDGTPYVMSILEAENELPNYCIVGEPSSQEKLADMIKVGRRGSLTGEMILKGKQGHVAYPHLADNPIIKIAPVLHELSKMIWDEGTEHFQPSSLQFTHIQSGGYGNNVIPGELKLQFNFRYSTLHSQEGLQALVESFFLKYDITPSIVWTHSGAPFLTQKGLLLATTDASILKHTGESPVHSTSGGTSDARFIAPYNIEVIELGPQNKTIHQINECIKLDDLITLSDIYLDIASSLLR